MNRSGGAGETPTLLAPEFGSPRKRVATRTDPVSRPRRRRDRGVPGRRQAVGGSRPGPDLPITVYRKRSRETCIRGNLCNTSIGSVARSRGGPENHQEITQSFRPEPSSSWVQDPGAPGCRLFHNSAVGIMPVARWRGLGHEESRRVDPLRFVPLVLLVVRTCLRIGAIEANLPAT